MTSSAHERSPLLILNLIDEQTRERLMVRAELSWSDSYHTGLWSPVTSLHFRNHDGKVSLPVRCIDSISLSWSCLCKLSGGCSEEHERIDGELRQ